jgi:hypothetical protein
VDLNEDLDSCGSARSSKAAQKAAEAQHLQALKEAAAEAHRDRKELLQRMQDLEHGPGSDANRSRPDSSEDGPANVRSSSASRRAEREAAEAQHKQALQEAAAQARRDRKQLLQKMQDLEERPKFETQPEAPHSEGSEYASDYAQRKLGRNSSRGEREAAEAQHLQALQDAAARAYQERMQLRQKANSTDDEQLISTIKGVGPGYPSPKGLRERLSRHTNDSPKVKASSLGDSGELRKMLPKPFSSPPKSASSPLSSAGVMGNRARSIDVSFESTRRRPLGGRSSSLSLAGSMLARSNSRSRPALEDGITSVPQSGLDSESHLSPHFGNRDSTEGKDGTPAIFGSRIGERLSKPLMHEAVDAPREVEVENIVEGAQPELFASTLRLPDTLPIRDLPPKETPAVELLELKLSRLKSPPPFRASLSTKITGADPHFSLALSADVAAPQVAPLYQSENPTLGSLSYTGTRTLSLSSQMSTASCIAAK